MRAPAKTRARARISATGIASDVRCPTAASAAPRASPARDSSHTDTVPVGEGWTKDPLAADLIDGKIYGRGSNDAKGCLAAMILAYGVANLLQSIAAARTSHEQRFRPSLLPAYNTILWVWLIGGIGSMLSETRREHLKYVAAGLATGPLLLASARHHFEWAREQARRGNPAFSADLLRESASARIQGHER